MQLQQPINQPPPVQEEVQFNESVEISEEAFSQISHLKITRACTLIKRLSPPPLTPLNHFGLFVELQNGQRFLIHNSPGNRGRFGTEIVVEESRMCSKWELHQGWEYTNQLTFEEIMVKQNYSMLNHNCFHSVNRMWEKLVPQVEFDIMKDPNWIKPQRLTMEDQFTLFFQRMQSLSVSDFLFLRWKQARLKQVYSGMEIRREMAQSFRIIRGVKYQKVAVYAAPIVGFGIMTYNIRNYLNREKGRSEAFDMNYPFIFAS